MRPIDGLKSSTMVRVQFVKMARLIINLRETSSSDLQTMADQEWYVKVTGDDFSIS